MTLEWRICEEDPLFIWLCKDKEPWKKVCKALFIRHLGVLGKARNEELELVFKELELKLAKQHALRLLAFKGRFSSELQKKLEEKGISADAVYKIMEECQRLGYLNDAEHIESAIRKEQRKGYGPRLIALKLKEHKEISEGMLGNLYVSQKEILEKLLKTKFRKVQWEDFKARQKAINQLQRRGFDFETIKEMIQKTIGVCI